MTGDTDVSDTHTANLVDALVAAVSALVGQLALRGITAMPERQYEAHWMESVPKDNTRSEGKSALYIEPAVESILWTYRDQLARLSPVAELGTMLSRFADSHGGFPASAWEPGPTDIATRVLHVYFTKSGSLAVDEATARHVIQDYCADISALTITVRSVFQVENFSAPHPFNLSDEIEFRPISHDDMKEQARKQLIPFSYGRSWLNISDWVCVVNKKGPKDTFEAINWDNEGIRWIAATLALASPGTARFALLSSRQASPFLIFRNQVRRGPDSHRARRRASSTS